MILKKKQAVFDIGQKSRELEKKFSFVGKIGCFSKKGLGKNVGDNLVRIHKILLSEQ